MALGKLGARGGFGSGGVLGTSPLQALLARLGAATLDLDFRSNTPESYGFTNSRTGAYYDIGSDGNYRVISAGTSDATAYDTNGNILGLGIYPSYSMLIDNNSNQGAVAGSATRLDTNGDFSLNPVSGSINTVLNGWQWSVNAGTGTVVWDGVSKVTLTGDGTHAARLTSGPITTSIGQTYTFFCDVATNTCSVLAGTTNGASNLLSATSRVANRQAFSFVATTTTSFISFQHLQANASVISHVAVITGKLPTNWECYTGNSNAGNVTAALISPTTTFGIDVTRVRISGTTDGAGSFLLNMTAFNHSVISTGTVCQQQMFLQQQAGSQTNISSIAFSLNEVDGSSNFLQNDQSSALTVSTSGDYRLATQVCNITAANVSAGFAQPGIAINFSGAVAFDITLDIGWPMFTELLEPRFRPPIRTTGSNVSVQTDNISLITNAFLNTPSVVIQCEWNITALNTLTTGFHPIPILFSDGVSSDRWTLSCASGFGNPGGGAQIVQGGLTAAIIDGGLPYALGQFHVQAAQISLTGVAVTIDQGNAGVSVTPPNYNDNGVAAVDVVTTAQAFTQVTLGRLLNGTDPYWGYLRRMRVWNNPAAAISHANIKTLSSGMGS